MGNDRGRRRRFGSVRQYRSGRWTAAYLGPDGKERRSPNTFATAKEAEVWLSQAEADITRQTWTDPEAGRVTFGEYAQAWLADHPNIGVRTRELYASQLRNHLLPAFGSRELREIKDADVRRWYVTRAWGIEEADGAGAVTHAKVYRLLHTIMPAIDDELIKRNPCRVRGAGVESSPERQVFTIDEVYRVAEAITPRYRTMVLLGAFYGLRLGELAGLRRSAVDVETGVVHVRSAQGQTDQGGIFEKGPKSAAGRRPMAVPDVLLPELRRQLDWFAEKGDDGLLFVGPRGGRLRRNNFNRIWKRALQRAGLPHESPEACHFHDLRHTGNTLATETGATLKELMARMGHSSTRAALVYLHATSERDRRIADELNKKIATTRKGGSKGTRPKPAGEASGADLVRDA